MKTSTGKSRRASARKNIDDSRQLALPGTLPATESGPAEGAPKPKPAQADDPVFQKALDVLRREFPAKPPVEAPSRPPSDSPDSIPARMLNEFVYCRRLFYYEFVEGVFVENADTLRGGAIHKKVDSGKGNLPPAAKQTKSRKSVQTAETATEAAPIENRKSEIENEVIHSRSVQLGSERLGVVAKLDLIEVTGSVADGAAGLTASSVVPVDYKAGAPREGADENELWPTDRMQLGLQMLLLRDNGYSCDEGVIYYRATKQRVRLKMTPELEAWIGEQIDAARAVTKGPIPPPLDGSPKCKRCSLAPVCLPDETRLLAKVESPEEPPSSKDAPRRLIASRDERRALYLNSPGLRIGRKDETLTVRDEDKLVDEVRLNDVNHVALFVNIQISTQAVQALCDAEIPLTYFSGGGWFYGVTRGHGLKNVFVRIEQFRRASDAAFSLRVARWFVHGKIRNHRTLLMRNHLEAPEPVLARLKQASLDVLQAGSLEELLGMEGAAAAVYFEHFGGMLKVTDAADDEVPGAESPDFTSGSSKPLLNFDFNGRNRRPPTDPINAVLSLAYSLLSKDCTVAAHSVGFDPYVGFYHQPRFGRPALALDLMEEFRPLIAESTVLSAVNNRVITPSDFVSAGEAVNLTPAGRKKFFLTYEQRMSSLLTHPLFDYKISYRRALELQARILARVLTGEIPEYVPLLTR
jgi:CRISPR-associated protein Cas1